jgi:hypothetical protein
VREDVKIVAVEEWQEIVRDREEWKKLLRISRYRHIPHIPNCVTDFWNVV